MLSFELRYSLKFGCIFKVRKLEPCFVTYIILLPTIAILIAVTHNLFYPNKIINYFMDLIVANKGNTLFGSIGLNDETEPTSSGSNAGSDRYFLLA